MKNWANWQVTLAVFLASGAVLGAVVTASTPADSPDTPWGASTPRMDAMRTAAAIQLAATVGAYFWAANR